MFHDKQLIPLLETPFKNTTSIFDIFNDNSSLAVYNFKNNANDMGGKYNGVWNGNEQYVWGKWGRVAKFDKQSYINTGIKTQDLIKNCSFVLWVQGNPEQNDGNVEFIGQRHTSGRGSLSLVWYNKDDKLFLQSGSGSETSVGFKGIGQLIKKWVQIAVVYKDEYQYLYINGNFIGSTELADEEDNNFDVYLGWAAHSKLNGCIGFTRFFNRPLTSEEVKKIHNEVIISKCLSDFFPNFNNLFIYTKKAPLNIISYDWLPVKKNINITDISDWDVSGNAGWEKVDDYFQNKDISDNQTATISKTFKQVKHIEFDYKVSSEHNYDFLDVYINGSRVIHISGNVDWQHYTQDFNEPTDVEIKFTYSKDSSESYYNDTAYFRNLIITIIQKNYNSYKGFQNRYKIKDYRGDSNRTQFKVTPYKNNSNNLKFRVTPYNNQNNLIKFKITPYKNKLKTIFYRLGNENPPPIRIILKDLDDED